jgi:hypothetical protein
MPFDTIERASLAEPGANHRYCLASCSHVGGVVLEEQSAGARGHQWGNCLRETEGI